MMYTFHAFLNLINQLSSCDVKIVTDNHVSTILKTLCIAESLHYHELLRQESQQLPVLVHS